MEEARGRPHHRCRLRRQGPVSCSLTQGFRPRRQLDHRRCPGPRLRRPRHSRWPRRNHRRCAKRRSPQGCCDRKGRTRDHRDRRRRHVGLGDVDGTTPGSTELHDRRRRPRITERPNLAPIGSEQRHSHRGVGWPTDGAI
ncbi:MAG: hypothetical protein EBY49_10075, partial [Actinobacteria bacterium]|nr:hypothetical protein [Actinomycetota bacterium]